MYHAMPSMNPWEQSALEYHFRKDAHTTSESSSALTNVAVAPKDSVHDAVIYPGLYAPSGYDMMSILIRVMSRANPTVDLGAIDASCALILCDLQLPDCPVVYANDPFMFLTGYAPREVIGRNCRFLQAPGGRVRRSSSRDHVDKRVIEDMRAAVASNTELSLEVVNFRKNGQRFVNILTMIPICWDSTEPRFSVGFQAEKTW